MTNPFARLAEWVTSIVESLGYVDVAALIALGNLFPPIPSELILPLAGFLTGQGRLWCPAVVGSATGGSVAGALALYTLGAGLGEARLRSLIERFGRFLALQEQDRVNGWFDRHGGKEVLLGRLVPVVRSLVSIPAGLRRMPAGRFVAYTAVGSSLRNATLIGLGWALGDQGIIWKVVRQYGQYLEYGTLAALIGAAMWFV